MILNPSRCQAHSVHGYLRFSLLARLVHANPYPWVALHLAVFPYSKALEMNGVVKKFKEPTRRPKKKNRDVELDLSYTAGGNAKW